MPNRPLFRWTAMLAILIALLTSLSSSFAGADHDSTIPSTQMDIVRVYYTDLVQRNKLLLSFQAQLLETDYTGGYHVLQITPHDVERLTRAGFRVQADPEWRPPPIPLSAASAVQSNGIPGYPCYRTVEETFAAAQQIAQEYPHLATWQDMGDSWEKIAGLGGYDLMVLRLTNRAVPGPKPVLLLSAAIHAREYTTAELVTRFAERLVADYGTDADVTWILDYTDVHAILHANPDGRKQAEAGLSWRKNTNQAYCGPQSNYRGVDLNRNFDFRWNCCNGSSDNECALDYHGPSAASEPEIQALQGYMKAVLPDQRGPDLRDAAPDDASGIFIDVHSYGELVLWPWGFAYQAAPNAVQLGRLGRKLAFWNRYTAQQSIGLYPTDGASEDYAYGELGVAAYTLELGTSFFQSCAAFENVILPDNLPALLYAAQAARAPYLLPAGPDSLRLSLSDPTVPAGASVILRAAVDDTRYNGSEPTQEIVGAEWFVDHPPWETGTQARAMDVSDGAWDSRSENVEAVVDTTGWSPGRHILFVRGQDADGNWGVPGALFIGLSGSTNDVPLARFQYQCQGLSCQFDASGSFDRDGQIIAFLWTFDSDGSASGRTAAYPYDQPGTYAVTLTVTDDQGATGSQTQTVLVKTPQRRLYFPYIHTHRTAR